MTAGTEPPRFAARALGGMLGILAAEDGHHRGHPISTALLAVGAHYVGDEDEFSAIDPRRVEPPPPAWLLPVAVVNAQPWLLVADVFEAAFAFGVHREQVAACVGYVELAAALFSGQPPAEAIARVTGGRPTLPAQLEVSDRQIDGALGAALWALGRPGSIPDIVAALVTASPGARAAAAGVVGLRDGVGALPDTWYRRLGPPAAACADLVPGLVRVRAGRRLLAGREGHP